MNTPDDATSSYSIANIFFLTEYFQVIYFPTAGLLVNVSPFDALLAGGPASPMVLVDPDWSSRTGSPLLALVQPSMQEFKRLFTSFSSQPMSDVDLLRANYRSGDPAVQRTISTSLMLKEEPSNPFNATTFLSNTGYMLFTDKGLPGPQYDVPYHRKVRSRPKGEVARYAWEKMYDTYRQERMEFCGLDLEAWEESRGT
jgi:hypothetical protein